MEILRDGSDRFARIRGVKERRARLDFFVRELGPPVYNQGVRDAAGYMQDRLADIEGEIYEQDPREP